ncbi:MAG: WXG100 family type VII secretion target [Oryzihumus sp.]|jgi:WXG100 family type VII secretion target|uniref:ESAT-6-like protein n=1 Tax=Oryzihumus leptocrescens TaxID=297536 RepID=A0A542ZH59_9MICO|nr:WXG100 family type VII secretion target [Oryzihumus leptocrescens]TQL59712.1 WXG100 family type VII secretion target [Oryzihumus leptocrescens]HET7661759.1 WXG100 family type VII secretion target [Oryzihumus sp.]
MAGEVSAADGAIDRGAKIISDTRDQLNSELSALRGKLAGIGAQWKGSGSTSFQSAMNRWDEDSRKIIDALNRFESNLRSSQSTYTQRDDSAQSSFSKLQSRLG